MKHIWDYGRLTHNGYNMRRGANEYFEPNGNVIKGYKTQFVDDAREKQ
jgi:hypothetical protein